VSQRISISTVQPGEARMLKDIDASDPARIGGVTVFDGDQVEVFSVRPILSNVVTVEGAVDQPAQYAMSPNMTVADLIVRARGLMPEAYPTRADIFRVNPDLTLTRFQVNIEKALARDPADNIPLVR